MSSDLPEPSGLGARVRYQLKRLAFLGGGILLITILGCRTIANHLLLHPSRDPVLHTHTRGFIPTEEGQLEYFEQEYGPEGPVQFSVLSLTGNGGRGERTLSYTRDLIAQTFVATHDLPALPSVRFRVMAINYPGYGQSEGKASLEKLGPAALAAYDELRSRNDSGPVLIHGLSMGTTAALHLARTLDSTEERPAGLLLEKGPDLWGLIVKRNGWWNLWLIALPVGLAVPESARSDLNAKKIEQTPAVFVVATEDRIVPPPYARSIVEAYSAASREVEATCGHNTAVNAANSTTLVPELRWLFDQAGIPLGQ